MILNLPDSPKRQRCCKQPIISPVKQVIRTSRALFGAELFIPCGMNLLILVESYIKPFS